MFQKNVDEISNSTVPSQPTRLSFFVGNESGDTAANSQILTPNGTPDDSTTSIRSGTGPPVRTLFGSFNASNGSTNMSIDQQDLRNIDLSKSLNNSSVLSNRSTSLYTSLNESRKRNGLRTSSEYDEGKYLCEEDRCWVTVFGFQPDDLDRVKAEFAKFGKIAELRVSSQSTWMHIRYKTEFNAKQALRRNGHMFKHRTGRCFIVGVVQRKLSNYDEDGGNMNINEIDSTKDDRGGGAYIRRSSFSPRVFGQSDSPMPDRIPSSSEANCQSSSKIRVIPIPASRPRLKRTESGSSTTSSWSAMFTKWFSGK